MSKECEISIGRKISKTQQSRKYFEPEKNKHFETYKKLKSLLHPQTHTHTPRIFLQIK